MKKQVLIIGAIALATMASQAAITSIDLTLGSRTSSSDTLTSLGTISVESGRPSSTGGAYQTMSYKVTGLTLDSVGTADDEITFELGLLGTGDNTVNGIAGDKNAYFAVASDNGGDDTLLENDEGLTISYAGATVTLGAGATETASIAFDGFTGFSAWNFTPGSESFNVSGTVASDATAQTVAANGGAYSLLATEDVFTIEGNVGSSRYSRFLTGVTVTTTIPEPATLGLVVASGAGILFIRRRLML